MPRGPRRNLRPVAQSMSQPMLSTSMSIWPTDWQASSRKGMPCCRAIRPTSSAGFTRPPLVGTWVMAISFVRGVIIASIAATSTWPVGVAWDEVDLHARRP